jgi:HEAT repeat protein
MMMDERPENFVIPRVTAIEIIGSEALLNELVRHHLLVEGRGKSEIEFCHQLLQEYYVAEWLRRRVPNFLKDENSGRTFQHYYLNYLKWTEPIAIMLGLPEITENQAIKIIELTLEVNLMLGARLAGEVKLQFQEQTIELVSATKLFDEAEVSDWLQVELLGRTGSRLALPKLRQFLKNPNLDIARKAAAWIGFLGYQEAIPDLLQMLTELDRWIPRRNGPQIPTDRTVSLEIDIIDAIGKLSPKDAALKLRNFLCESSTYIYFRLQPKLGNLLSTIDPEFSTEWSLNLLENTRDPERVRQASDLLCKVGYSDVPSKLIQRLHCEKNPQFSEAIINALGLFDTDETVSALTNLIKEPDSSIRKQAAITLIEHRRTNATDNLIPHLCNSDWNIRWCAAVVLGNFCSNAAIPLLLEGLLDKEHRLIRITAAKVLGMIKNDEVILALRSSLKDPDYAVRRSAAISLAKFNEQEAIPELLKALRHYYLSDDSSALGIFNTEEVIRGLFDLLHKGFKAAAVPLGKLGKQEVVPELIELLQDPNQISSSNKVIDTLVFLASLGNLSIVSQLLSILENINDYKHTDFYFSNRVAIVLAKIEHEAMSGYLPALVKLLPTEVGEQASWAIAAIQSRCGFYNYEITQVSLPKLQNINEKVEKGGVPNIYQFPSANKVQIFEQVDKFINHGNSKE